MSPDYPTHPPGCKCSGCHWSHTVTAARAPLLTEIEALKKRIAELETEAERLRMDRVVA